MFKTRIHNAVISLEISNFLVIHLFIEPIEVLPRG